MKKQKKEEQERIKTEFQHAMFIDQRIAPNTVQADREFIQ